MDLNQCIEASGLNPNQIAQKIGVSPSALCLWRSGRRLPNRDSMIKLIEWSEGKLNPATFYE